MPMREYAAAPGQRAGAGESVRLRAEGEVSELRPARRQRHDDETGAPIATGMGLFAAALRRRLPDLPVEDELRLEDPGSRGVSRARRVSPLPTRHRA